MKINIQIKVNEKIVSMVESDIVDSGNAKDIVKLLNYAIESIDKLKTKIISDYYPKG